MQRQSSAPLMVIDSPAALSGVIKLVNPMTEVDAKLAGAFLNGPLAKPLFIHFRDSFRVMFMRDGDHAIHAIYFSGELCRYTSKKTGSTRYAVKGQFLGKGSFCSVYQVTQTLKTNGEGVAVCTTKSPDKWLAIKVFDKQEPIKFSKQEYEILSIIPSMRTKKNEISPATNKASLLMAYIPGEDLIVRLQAHRDATRPLSVLQRLELSRELFAALNDVHQGGIIHRDVKVENIRVSFKADGSIDRVAFIDFNLAKKKGLAPDRYEGVGSPAYASPEAFTNIFQDEKSDLYSLGRVLWCVWGLRLDFTAPYQYLQHDDDINHFRLYVGSLQSLPFLFLDVAVSALSATHRKQIHELLLAINNNNKALRPDAAAAIQVFDSVIAEYKRAMLIQELEPMAGIMQAAAVTEMPSAAIKLQDEPVTRFQLPSIHCQQSSPLLFSPAAAAAAASPKPVKAKQTGDNQCVLF